jgi:hypothetical protein
MLQNPLIQRYRFSLLRPRQVGVYGFIYVSIVFLILLLNYTAFTTLRAFLFSGNKLPFDMYQFVFYQFAFFQVIILWLWASYNSGSALTLEILRKSYVFFKLLPISALQKAFGVLIGTNLVAYSCAALNFIPLLIFAYLGKMNTVLISYYFLTMIAVACFLNALTLLLSINPDAKKRRRFGTLVLIVFAVWVLMFAMGRLFSSGTHTREVENILVGFFSIDVPGLLLFSMILFYFTAWMLMGIVRKFRDEKESLFSKTGSLVFVIGCEVLTTGLFWSFLHLKSGFYSHRALCFWGLVFVNLGTLQNVGKYLEAARRIQAQSTAKALNMFRLFRHSTLFWGICVFVIWTACFLGLAMMTGLTFPDNLYPLLNLFGFYLVFMVLLELFILYRHLRINIKVVLIGIALISLLLPVSLSKILENKLVYLHSVFGYMSNLIAPFLFQSGNTAVQLRIFFMNILLCLFPLFLIFRKYLSFLKLRRQM